MPSGGSRPQAPVERRPDAGARLAVAPLPLAEGPCLLDVPADLHQAPAAGAVLRVVEESPMADVARARLESLPAALLDRACDDRHQATDRPVHARALGRERSEERRVG